jgi:hypothetical protein
MTAPEHEPHCVYWVDDTFCNCKEPEEQSWGEFCRLLIGFVLVFGLAFVALGGGVLLIPIMDRHAGKIAAGLTIALLATSLTVRYLTRDCSCLTGAKKKRKYCCCRMKTWREHCQDCGYGTPFDEMPCINRVHRRRAR